MCPLTMGVTTSGTQPSEATASIWAAIEEAAVDVGSVLLCGFGETLLDRDLTNRMEKLDAQRVQFSLATNGTLITEKLVEQLNRYAYLSHINVSIDSPDAATYKAIRGGKVEKALAGLTILARKFRSPEAITVSSVAMIDSLPTLHAFPAILAKLGLRDYILQRLTDWDQADAQLSPGQRFHLHRCLRRLKNAAALSRIRLHYDRRIDSDLGLPRCLSFVRPGPRAVGSRTTRVCTAPWEVPFINKDGRVYPCCNSVDDDGAVMGDLSDRSFREIWNGARFAGFRRQLLSGRDLPKACRGCGVAPLGPHPFNETRAVIQSVTLVEAERRISVAVRNSSSRTWTARRGLQLSTLRLRATGNSDFRHPDWLSRERICGASERIVHPGRTARFDFSVSEPETAATEVFQLVTSDGHWLPGTQFRLTFDPAAMADHGRFAVIHA